MLVLVRLPTLLTASGIVFTILRGSRHSQLLLLLLTFKSCKILAARETVLKLEIWLFNCPLNQTTTLYYNFYGGLRIFIGFNCALERLQLINIHRSISNDIASSLVAEVSICIISLVNVILIVGNNHAFVRPTVLIKFNSMYIKPSWNLCNVS